MQGYIQQQKEGDIIFDMKVILIGIKDPSTDLWMLPIPHRMVGTTTGCLLP
jgi:hypothetical protein